jgi:hypothetical protein
MEKEVSGLLNKGTWSCVLKSSLPIGTKIMGSQFVFKDKPITGAKARLVVRGDQQDPYPLTGDTYTPTPAAAEVRMLFSLSAQLDRPIHSMDAIQAFTQADDLPADSELYVYPPHGYQTDRDYVWKLNKPLYGLAIAPKSWADTLKRFLVNYGFDSVNGSDTFFVLDTATGENLIQLVFHVDDILFNFASDSIGLTFKNAFMSRFHATDDGPVKCFVCITVTRDEHKIHLSQLSLTESLLNDFKMMDCNPAKTPMAPGTLMTHQTADDPTGPDCTKEYQHLVGTLMYITTWTRPDLAFATHQLAKFMSCPYKKHMDKALHVLRYLKGTKNLGITYTRGLPDPNRLLAFADADWASCTETRRSISGFLCLLNGGAIHWRSRQQCSVATSTAEAEFVAAARAADELVWLRRVMKSAGQEQKEPTPMWEDNRACRMMSENPVTNDRSKHIDYRVHALRERVRDGIVRLIDCPTVNMAADPMTKNLPIDAFERHRAVMLGSARHEAPAIPDDLTACGPRESNSKHAAKAGWNQRPDRPGPAGRPSKVVRSTNPYMAPSPNYFRHNI